MLIRDAVGQVPMGGTGTPAGKIALLSKVASRGRALARAADWTPGERLQPGKHLVYESPNSLVRCVVLLPADDRNSGEGIAWVKAGIVAENVDEAPYK